MCNDSRYGGRYTERRESREKDSLWRIGANVLPPCVAGSQQHSSLATSGFAGTWIAIYQSTRCTISADGLYEWRKEGSAKSQCGFIIRAKSCRLRRPVGRIAQTGR